MQTGEAGLPGPISQLLVSKLCEPLSPPLACLSHLALQLGDLQIQSKTCRYNFHPSAASRNVARSLGLLELARHYRSVSHIPFSFSLCVVYKGFIMFSTNQKGPANTQLTCDYKKKN